MSEERAGEGRLDEGRVGERPCDGDEAGETCVPDGASCPEDSVCAFPGVEGRPDIPEGPLDLEGSPSQERPLGPEAAGARTVALLLSYNGAPFCGFARQPGLSTVQGELEDALRLLFRREVLTTCAGRTDAGVHALGQVVSFDLSQQELDAHPLPALRRSLDALTDEAISIREARQAPDGFSARFDAKSREYRYFLHTGRARPVFMRDFSWHLSDELDVGAMREGARHLLGEHDFKSFCRVSSAEGKPTCRNVQEISLQSQEVMGEDVLVVKVVGNAFLHSMVRTIVGTLVAVGRGLREPAWVAEALAACDRRAAGETAPAQGLVLWKVEY